PVRGDGEERRGFGTGRGGRRSRRRRRNRTGRCGGSGFRGGGEGTLAGLRGVEAVAVAEEREAEGRHHADEGEGDDAPPLHRQGAVLAVEAELLPCAVQ